MQRSLISLIAGGILAIGAIVLLNIYFRNSGTGTTSSIELTTVVVAAADLPVGTQIDQSSLKVVSWPTASVPPGAFHSVEELFRGAPSSQDRVVLTDVEPNEPVVRGKISGFGQKATLSRELPPGMRAISIRVDDVSGVAGFMLPGDRVDIMLTRHVTINNVDTMVSDILLQNITILGVDQSSDQKRDQPVVGRTATVEVTPEQAQKLVLAQVAGTLSLALRNVANTEQLPTAQVTARDLGVGQAPHVVPAVRRNSVKVIYGDGSSSVMTVH